MGIHTLTFNPVQLVLMKKEAASVNSRESLNLRQEVRQLRENLRHLRDANHCLTQDNIKLTEYIRDLDATEAVSLQNGTFFALSFLPLCLSLLVTEKAKLIKTFCTGDETTKQQEPRQANQSLTVFDKGDFNSFSPKLNTTLLVVEHF